jgi:Tfp pilus assembly protein PilV
MNSALFNRYTEHPYRLICRASGFSLVEVLLSMTLISLSVLGLMGMQSSMVAHSRYTQDKLYALYLAESKMEQIRKTGLVEGEELSPMAIKDKPLDKFVVGASMSSDSSLMGLSYFEVIVSWQDAKAKQHSVALKSAIYTKESL